VSLNFLQGVPFGLGGGYWLLLITLGVILDWLIGDPAFLFHPIILIGKAIGFLNKVMNKGSHRRSKGFALLIIVVLMTALVVLGLQYLTFQLNFILYSLLNVYLITMALASKTLAQEVMKVMNVLKKGDLEQSRVQVGYLVGRDTQQLTETEIIRATIETTAENTIDGVLAPIFYLFIGALLPVSWLNPVVLVMVYKAVNTLDSMVGYIQEPYREFGYASAKFDDIINFLPARLGSFLMLLAGFFLGYSMKEGLAVFLRDRLKHKSPNSAHPESVVAGLLGIELGGTNHYFGQVLEKPTIGVAKSPLNLLDIRETVGIMYASEIVTMVLGIAFGVIILILI
jgi:adenosylcobinamide-phosphate synthase